MHTENESAERELAQGIINASLFIYTLSDVVNAFSGGEVNAKRIMSHKRWIGRDHQPAAVCTSNFINAITVNQIGRLDARAQNPLTWYLIEKPPAACFKSAVENNEIRQTENIKIIRATQAILFALIFKSAEFALKRVQKTKRQSCRLLVKPETIRLFFNTRASDSFY